MCCRHPHVHAGAHVDGQLYRQAQAVVSCVAGLRRAAHVAFTPRYAARTPPTRVAAAFRTAHLHSGPISRTKLRRAFDAPIISNGFFRPFGPPPIWVGVGPSPGFAVLPFALVWQAKKAVANKKAAEEAAPVRPHTGCVASPSHCRDTYSCVHQQQPFIHT